MSTFDDFDIALTPEENEELKKKQKEKHCKILAEYLIPLINKKEGSDVTFLVGRVDRNEELKPIYAHRAILAARSRVFRAMLFKGFKERNLQEIKIPNISYETFLSLLRYIYSGEIIIDEKNILEILPAADQYGLHELRKSCFEIIVKSLNKDTVCSMMIAAQNGDYDFNADQLITQCIKYVEKHTDEVFSSDSFLLFDERIMIEMLQSDNLDIDEIDLFREVIRWGKSRQQFSPEKSLKEILANLIPHIRFPLISASDLITIVRKEDVVPNNLYLEALEYNAAPHCTPADVLETSKKYKSRGSSLYVTLTKYLLSSFTWEIPDRCKNFFTLSDNNLKVQKTSGSNSWTSSMIFGSKPLKSGKIYFEVVLEVMNSDRSGTVLGLTENKNTSYYSSDIVVGMSGNKYKTVGGNCACNQGDRVGIFVDFPKLQVRFYRNGVPMGVTGYLQKGKTYWPVFHMYYVNNIARLQFPAQRPRS